MNRVLAIVLVILSLIFFKVDLHAQNVKKQTWYNVEKTKLKEEYYLNNKNKKTLEGLYTAYYLNGKVKMRGFFENSLYQGYWEFYYENGNKKSAGYYVNNLPEGIWKYYFENQNIQMQGKLVNGKKDSTWSFYYENQIIKSIGEYEMDTVSGQWKYFYEDGQVKGDAILSDNSGWYREYYVDGVLKMEGQLKNGLGDSTWTYYHENGAVKAVGNERKGLKDGFWIYYHDNKVVAARGNYLNGEQVGNWKYYYPNSKISSEGDLKAGVKDGKWLSYYEIGGLKAESILDIGDGSYKEYYLNGKLKIDGYIKQEKNHGEWKYYYENGNLEAVCQFVDGEGWYKGYFPNGKLKMEGKIKDGNKIGSWKLYDSDEGLAGYYKTYYDKEPEKILNDSLQNKDSVIVKEVPKEVVDVYKKVKRTPTRYYNESLNRYTSTIISCNPIAIMRGSFPIYIEYYKREKMGLEVNFTIYRVPFFGSVAALGDDKLFALGYALGIKQRFYTKITKAGMFYVAHEAKYQELNYSAYMKTPSGGSNFNSANTDVYQYTIQFGDRLLHADENSGVTMDIFIGAGVGLLKYKESLDGQATSDELFKAIRKPGIFVPLQLGFSFGYIL